MTICRGSTTQLLVRMVRHCSHTSALVLLRRLDTCPLGGRDELHHRNEGDRNARRPQHVHRRTRQSGIWQQTARWPAQVRAIIGQNSLCPSQSSTS